MGRPYGVGFYGTHRYSRGSYVRLASVAQAAVDGSGAAREVERRLWVGTAAQAAAYAAALGIVETSVYAAGVGRAFGAPFRVVNRKLTTPRADAAPARAAVEVDFFPATHLSAQATAYAPSRFAWEGEGGEETGPWVLQPAGPGRLWRPQGERPPRPYGRGRYSVGMYSTNPPELFDRWSEV